VGVQRGDLELGLAIGSLNGQLPIVNRYESDKDFGGPV
jgi:hypothetical protein